MKTYLTDLSPGREAQRPGYKVLARAGSIRLTLRGDEYLLTLEGHVYSTRRVAVARRWRKIFFV